MLGLPAAVLRDLRQQFRRTKVAELIDRLAKFEQCFASAKFFADELGVCSRTVFRYFRLLKSRGLLDRVPGSRFEGHMPSKSTEVGRVKLKAHGYAITCFRGSLAHLVAQGQSQAREKSGQRDQRQRDYGRRQEIRERNEKSEAKAEFLGAILAPPPVVAAPSRRRDAQPPPPPSPHSWGEADWARINAQASELLDEPATGPPD